MKSQRKLTSEELSSFFTQTAILLHAGITPVESMRILLSDTTDASSKELLQEIIDSINKGNSFAESLNETGVFPVYVFNTVKLGEEAGLIDEVMQSLANYYERESQIADSVKSAVTYPLVMIVMMLAVIIVLITKVLPIFNQVFVQLGSEMTGFAASLMRVGTTLNSYSLVFIIILAVIVLLSLFFAKTEVGRTSFKKIINKLHIFKNFYAGIAAGRFASGMAISLSSGLDTFGSLDMVSSLVEHKETEEKINICKQEIQKGTDFSEALKDAQIFSNVDNRMVAVGFKSGNVEEIMNRIANEYEQKTEKKLYAIISVIEPTLVIILSLIVGLILLSVIMPLMGVMSTIG